MRLKARALFLLASLFGGSLNFGQTNPQKGREVVDQAVAALGGERFLQLKTRKTTGRAYAFFHDQLSGLSLVSIFSEYAQTKPASGLAVQEREYLGKKQDYSYLFLHNQAWDITYRGARPIPDENWERYERTTENDILYFLRMRLNEPGLEFDFVGSEVEISRHVEVVDITDSRGRTIRVAFDHNSRFPIRSSFSWLDPETKQRNDEITQYDKFRDIGGGVFWPLTIERERNGYKTYQIFASGVEANVPIPAKTFELPPGAKMLKKVD